LDRRLSEAARLGFTTALVPGAHRGETVAPAAAGIRTIPVATVADAVTAVRGLGSYVDRNARRAALRSLDGGRPRVTEKSL
jgi:hypothetical protein